MRRLLLASLIAACGVAHAALPEPVARLAAANGIPEEAIGALVLRGDQTLVSNMPDQPFAPASTMKLVTTMVGLDELGPVFKGRTELRSNGQVSNGTLYGDLVLRGGADGDFTVDAFTHMLEKLRTQGIRRIEGNLVLDRTLWQPSRLDVGAPQFDESPEAYYNVIPDALWLNMNMLTVDIASDAKSVRVSMLPELDKVSVKSELELTNGECAKWEDGWKVPEYVRNGSRLTVVLKGTYPRNCAKTNVVNVLDRHDFTERFFRATWARLGGKFSGSVVEAEAPSSAANLLAEHVSRTLPEIVRDTNKPSDNGLARSIFLSLGSLQADAKLGSRPLDLMPAAAASPGGGDVAPSSPTLARSELVVRNWMRAHGIDDTGLVLENGSGLSRVERIRPVQMAGLLRAAQKSLWAPEFLTSLPIAGVDGTMKRRLKESTAAQRARVKTGTLRDVVAVAGYVPDANGQLCIVVAMVNHDHAGNGVGRSIVDALIDWTAHTGTNQLSPLPEAAGK
ncbi:D-alanyl-D-alanine carboxypeptidase/D-alanyl-D-alanine-endopeptidase [Pseudoduganella sp. RAF19]|uniref:D-alanyl-D-alanine carboxypeptidase/D-alanyl-D-alanine endopeptidase n=1 Tax=Pseudoduganella sp. RAF19 TaxID=3233052 RepID=UPI003F9A04B0